MFLEALSSAFENRHLSWGFWRNGDHKDSITYFLNKGFGSVLETLLQCDSGDYASQGVWIQSMLQRQAVEGMIFGSQAVEEVSSGYDWDHIMQSTPLAWIAHAHVQANTRLASARFGLDCKW